MGYNTTVVILNDALDSIATDPDFGRNLAEEIKRSAFRPDTPNDGVPVDTVPADERSVTLIARAETRRPKATTGGPRAEPARAR